MTDPVRKLGDVASSELLLKELYVELRRKLAEWAKVTFQTPQARMGYIGQHLTSVVTGYPGGRSGARGYDLRLPGDEHAEIKTCYRVDQLGSCGSCGSAVASVEPRCPACDSADVIRKDDSKWLVTIRNDDEMRALFDPKWYYLVLFDADDGDPSVIHARIWRADPRRPGFALCMVDYYANIKSKSTSGAPFNLWPFSLKFELLRADLVYHARILGDDTIQTLVFEGKVGHAGPHPVSPLTEHVGSRKNLTDGMLRDLAAHRGVKGVAGLERRRLLEALEKARRRDGWDDDELADELAELMYRPGIAKHRDWLPKGLRR